MSGNKHGLGSDLAKVDAHVIQPEEYEEIPELDDEWFAKADLREGGKLIRRGRPPKETPKVPVTLRLDADLVAQLKAGGKGWQTRVNDILRTAEGLPKVG
ncbi:MAG: BrnA antitoxin family protein [Magnetospirillum sp.]